MDFQEDIFLVFKDFISGISPQISLQGYQAANHTNIHPWIFPGKIFLENCGIKFFLNTSESFHRYNHNSPRGSLGKLPRFYLPSNVHISS